MNNKVTIVVEFHNCAPEVYEVFINTNDPKEILETIVSHFKYTQDFNEDKDSITIVNDSTPIYLSV